MMLMTDIMLSFLNFEQKHIKLKISQFNMYVSSPNCFRHHYHKSHTDHSLTFGLLDSEFCIVQNAPAKLLNTICQINEN